MVYWRSGVSWAESGSIPLWKNQALQLGHVPSASWGQPASLLCPKVIIGQHIGSPRGFPMEPGPVVPPVKGITHHSSSTK